MLKATLGDFVSTRKGFAFKSEWYSPNGRPIVKVSNFTDDSVDTSELICIPEDVAENYLSYALKARDVIIQTVGSWPNNPRSVVGKAVRIPAKATGALLNQNAVKVLPNDHIDQDFLFYILRSNEFATYIVGTAQGAANQASITLDAIRGFPLHLPTFNIQHKIAAILAAYDDLIANNIRRIQILEEIAQTLYHEWFVKFRYPGHERSRNVVSEVGPIPEGWHLASLLDVPAFRLISENVSAYDGERVYLATADVNGIYIVGVGQMCAYSNRPSRAQKQPLLNSVWFARMRDTYKVLGFTDSNRDQVDSTILSSGFAGFESEPDCFPFLYYSINSKWFHEKKDLYATGATQVSLTNEGLTRITLTMPESEVMRRYGRLVKPNIDEIFTLQAVNRNLRQTRDLLLPKLISGEVDVADLDIATGEPN